MPRAIACPDCGQPVALPVVQMVGTDGAIVAVHCDHCLWSDPDELFKTKRDLVIWGGQPPEPELTVLTARITADQTFTSSTLANVTSMVFTAVSGVTYQFSFHLILQTAATPVGIKLNFTKPSVISFGQSPAEDTCIAYSRAPAANTDFGFVIEGSITPSAGGLLQLQAANTDNATTVTLRRGSTALMTVLP